MCLVFNRTRYRSVPPNVTRLGDKVVCYKYLRRVDKHYCTPYQYTTVDSDVLVSNRREMGKPLDRITALERQGGVLENGIHLFCSLAAVRVLEHGTDHHIFRVLVDPKDVLAWSREVSYRDGMVLDVCVPVARMDLKNRVEDHHAW